MTTRIAQFSINNDLIVTETARTGKALILATRPFEQENVARSWAEVAVTLLVYCGCIAVVVFAPWWALRVAASVVAGLVQFRIFSLYHDHNHGSLLARSPAGRGLMSALGIFILTPRAVWKETHDFHHWHNGKLEWTSIGSYPVMTVDQLAAAPEKKREKYLRTRHWLGLVGGYFTVGIGGMCLAAFMRNPKRHYMGPVALALHLAVLVALAWQLGPLLALLAWVLPTMVNHALASYLFYSQHNFPGTKFFVRGTWNYTEAALHGSSFMEMGPAMRWFTANIGYHHVHHLNAKIPSYRLPAAMAALPELQQPLTTSFRPADVLACVKLRAWDAKAQRMLTADALTKAGADAPRPADEIG